MTSIEKKFCLVYKTSITPFFPICLIGKPYTGKLKRLGGLNLKPRDIVVLISNGTVNWFFDQNLGINTKEIFSKIFSKPKYLQRIKIKEREISKNLLKEIKTPVKELFSQGILNKKGEVKLKKIFNYYETYAEYVDAPGFFFQIYLSDEAKKELFQKLIDKSEEEKNEIFNFLFSSYKKTNFERFLFLISKNLKNKKEHQKIADKFYWLIHDYIGDIVDLKYVKDKVKEFENDKKTMGLYIQGAIDRVKKIKKIKKELPVDIFRRIDMIQQILYLYNERKKEVLNKVNIYLRRIMEYRFPNISVSKIRDYYQITSEEIIRLLKGEKVKELDRRNKKWVYLIKNGVITSGSEKYFFLMSKQKKIKILKGTPASSGKIKGRVNLILNISHIYKFKKGDILVAPFTNLNYLPIMSKARAILTETGGLTSHATIASRELKKPCIVNIKNLIQVLKDGDLVEVDANHGIIKIL